MEIIVKHRHDLDKGYLWEVYVPFRFKTIIHCEYITIPNGFITDFASVPRALWSFIPSIGTYNVAALVHDYLYTTNYFNKDYSNYQARKEADREFYAILRYISPKKKIRNYVMFACVRMFGYNRYKKYATNR